MAAFDPRRDVVDRPHWIWFVVVWGGLALLAALAFIPSFHAWYGQAVHAMPSQTVLVWVLLACLPIHVFEGWLALKICEELGMTASAKGWAWQCFALGYPSTRLLLKRRAAARALTEAPAA